MYRILPFLTPRREPKASIQGGVGRGKQHADPWTLAARLTVSVDDSSKYLTKAGIISGAAVRSPRQSHIDTTYLSYRMWISCARSPACDRPSTQDPGSTTQVMVPRPNHILAVTLGVRENEPLA